MNAEQRLWQDALTSAAPGWNMAVADPAALGTGALSCDSYLYLVDTMTGNAKMYGLHGADFARARANVRKDPEVAEAARGCAPHEVVRAAGEGEHTPASERTAASAVLHALVQFQTYDASCQRNGGKPAAHWVYMTYRNEQSPGALGRCVALQWAATGPMPLEEIMNAVRAVIAFDSDPDTQVGRSIRQMGGATLAASLQEAAGGQLRAPRQR